jgi:hypothetical protein
VATANPQAGPALCPSSRKRPLDVVSCATHEDRGTATRESRPPARASKSDQASDGRTPLCCARFRRQRCHSQQRQPDRPYQHRGQRVFGSPVRVRESKRRRLRELINCGAQTVPSLGPWTSPARSPTTRSLPRRDIRPAHGAPRVGSGVLRSPLCRAGGEQPCGSRQRSRVEDRKG